MNSLTLSELSLLDDCVILCKVSLRLVLFTLCFLTNLSVFYNKMLHNSQNVWTFVLNGQMGLFTFSEFELWYTKNEHTQRVLTLLLYLYLCFSCIKLERMKNTALLIPFNYFVCVAWWKNYVLWQNKIL